MGIDIDMDNINFKNDAKRLLYYQISLVYAVVSVFCYEIQQCLPLHRGQSNSFDIYSTHHKTQRVDEILGLAYTHLDYQNNNCLAFSLAPL